MFYFVIDGNQYAGNFEREMTAFITGCVGDCGVGSELSEELLKDGIPAGFFDDLVVSEPDEHGCSRPCKIWDTPGWFNEGLGGNFQDGQEDEAKAFHRAKCLERANDLCNVLPRNVESHRSRWLEKADEFKKYPAYNSLAICMERPPTEEEFNVLKSRALKWIKYVEDCLHKSNPGEGVYCHLKSPSVIFGFRLIEEKTTYTEIQSWSI